VDVIATFGKIERQIVMLDVDAWTIRMQSRVGYGARPSGRLTG
jgi:hypothetical protein